MIGPGRVGSRETAPSVGDEEKDLGHQWSPLGPRGAFGPADHWCPWQLGQEGKVPLQSAHLYYNVTEKVRRVMESYFRLDTPLYFSYSHLVCRTAIEGGPPSALHRLCGPWLGAEDMVPFILVWEPT